MDTYTSSELAQASTSTTHISFWGIIFIALILFFLVYSAILFFHWFSFSMRTRTAIVATIIYMVISSVFIITMFSDILTLSTY